MEQKEIELIDENGELRQEVKNYFWELANKCAITPGDGSRWTKDDRVVVCYSVLCSMTRVNLREQKLKE